MKFTKYFLLFAIFIVSSQIAIAITDSNSINNVLNKTINVTATQSISIEFVPIDGELLVGTIEENIEFLNKTYPLADTGLNYQIADYSFNSDIQGLSEEDKDLLLKKLNRQARIRGIDRIVGITPLNWFNDFNSDSKGFTDIYFGQNPVQNAPMKAVVIEEARRHLAAHELGHTFGLCDEYNDSIWEAQDSDKFWFFNFGNNKCPNGDIDNNDVLDSSCLTGESGEGCEAEVLGKLVPWQSSNENMILRNFMGNSQNHSERWVSNSSYVHLLNQFKSNSSCVGSGKGMVVSGTTYRNGSSSRIDNVYIIEGDCIRNESSSGNSSIIIEIGGNVFYNHTYQPTYAKVSADGNITETNFSSFVFVLPFNNSLTRILVQDNESTVLVDKNKSTNTPTLSINTTLQNTLINNNFTLAYNASDADGDVIEYAILISPDNGDTFSTLEIDHPNKTLFVNTSSFTESQQYKVKILSTDGINTNTTISQGTFEIDNDLRITDLSVLHKNNTKRIFYYRSNNTLQNNLSNVNEQLDTGVDIINLTTNHSLGTSEEIMMFIEYNYTTTGDKTLTATATSGNFVEIEFTTINIGIDVNDLAVLNSSNTTRIFGFDIENNLNIDLTSVNWTLNTGLINITAKDLVALMPEEALLVFVNYNYTSTGSFNINTTAINSTLQDSEILGVSVT